jgi:hypothetical protein
MENESHLDFVGKTETCFFILEVRELKTGVKIGLEDIPLLRELSRFEL